MKEAKWRGGGGWRDCKGKRPRRRGVRLMHRAADAADSADAVRGGRGLNTLLTGTTVLTGARVVQEASWPRYAPTHILSKSHKDASGGRVSLRRHRNKQADQRRSAAGDWWKFQRHRSCWGNMKLISRRREIKGDR